MLPLMRAVIQRVLKAKVCLDEKTIVSIGPGLLVLISFEKGDNQESLEYIKKKILQLRIFADDQGKMNRSVAEEGKEILLIPNFTVSGDARYGNRPDFTSSASFSDAEQLFHRLEQALQKEMPTKVQKGLFGAYMLVELINDGPVTILLDSNRKF